MIEHLKDAHKSEIANLIENGYPAEGLNWHDLGALKKCLAYRLEKYPVWSEINYHKLNKLRNRITMLTRDLH